jgi:hypothetical protein
MQATEAWQKGDKSIQEGSSVIYQTILKSLDEGKGALIGRHGTIELTTMLLYEHTNTLDKQRLPILEKNAGIFPKTQEAVTEWIKAYREASESADVMAAGWYAPLAKAELHFLEKIAPSVHLAPLRALEPYYLPDDACWMRALEDQSVAVVSSFTSSMSTQLPYRKDIWIDRPNMLPTSVKWSFVRSYYSPALAKGRCHWQDGINSWKDAVDYLEASVLQTGAKICLIGCGGLAMPLAARLKQKGVICIVLGGAIQILFGIKGKRWEKHPFISTLFTEEWIYPRDDEIPNGSEEVEGGCYW